MSVSQSINEAYLWSILVTLLKFYAISCNLHVTYAKLIHANLGICVAIYIYFYFWNRRPKADANPLKPKRKRAHFEGRRGPSSAKHRHVNERTNPNQATKDNPPYHQAEDHPHPPTKVTPPPSHQNAPSQKKNRLPTLLVSNSTQHVNSSFYKGHSWPPTSYRSLQVRP